MEFACAKCGGRVVDGQCMNCSEIYITICPRCGNNLRFEQVSLGGQVMLRCVTCENDRDLEMVALDPFA